MSNIQHPTPNTQLLSPGYTLLEAMIALSVFLLVVVPLIGRLSTAGRVNRARDKVTATCLLEQESAIVRADPTQFVPRKRRNIAGRQWVIRTRIVGADLKTCVMSAVRNGKQQAKVTFYVYREHHGD